MKTIPDEGIALRLANAFAAEEARLLASLAEARSKHEHRGIKGDILERAFRDFLSRHLPRKFSVGTGEVIDRRGARSSQSDVIVSNDEQPFISPQDDPGLYLFEGVTAVGEVKTSLGSGELKDILQKGALLRRLVKTIPEGAEVNGALHDLQRFVDSVPYFAIAFESTLQVETILKKLRDFPDVVGQDGVARPALDALFVVGIGAFYHFGDGTGRHRFTTHDGVNGTGWIGPFPEGVMTGIFVWLNSTMPRVRFPGSIATPYFVGTNLHHHEQR